MNGTRAKEKMKEGASGSMKKRILLLSGEKGLARLGDAFVNFTYSAAKTNARGQASGEKVPDRVLSRAVELSRLPVPARLDHGERGDIAEALLAYAWTKRMLSIEETIEALSVGLLQANYDSISLEREQAAKAFASLLKLAAQRVEEAESD